MKKTFRIIGMALVAMIVAISFNACSSDDNDEPADPATHDSALVGTWTAYEEGSDWWEKVEVKMNANGTFRLDNTYYDEEDGKETYWAKGEWRTNNGILYISVTSSNDRDAIGETESGAYYISGNKLTYDGTVYTKK